MQVIATVRHAAVVRVMSETNLASATSDVLLTPSDAIGVRHLFFCKLLFLITAQLRIIPASGHVLYSLPSLVLKMLVSGISSDPFLACWSPPLLRWAQRL